MKLFRIFAIAALAMFTGASAQAGVAVLSNIAGPVDANVNAAQTVSTRNAYGFTVGSSDFTLENISAAFASGTPGTAVNVQFSIYTDNGGAPGTKIVGADSSLESVDNRDVYNFGFSTPVSLSASTTYWAVVEEGAGAGWYAMDNGFTPTAQNGSGFVFVGNQRSQDFDSGKTWASHGIGGILGFELTGTVVSGEVPEPALTSLLCLGGVALIRRRMKK